MQWDLIPMDQSIHITLSKCPVPNTSVFVGSGISCFGGGGGGGGG